MESAQLPERKPFRILSLDGGGVRAVLQAIILKRLLTSFPNFLDEIDLFAGTSAGAITATALATGLKPDDILEMWQGLASEVFSEHFYTRLARLDNCIGAPYSNAALRQALEKRFGTKTLADVDRQLFVPSFKLDTLVGPDGSQRRWGPTFFHNLSGSLSADSALVDVLLRTSAAPTYFPIYQGYIDGGVFANNPAMSAVVAAMSSGVRLEDIVVLSISTGYRPKSINAHQIGNGNWGLYDWGFQIVDLLFDSSVECADYQAVSLLGERYLRIDPVLPVNFGLDQASAIPQLEQIGWRVELDSGAEWIGRHFSTKQLKPLDSTPDGATVPSSQTPPQDRQDGTVITSTEVDQNDGYPLQRSPSHNGGDILNSDDVLARSWSMLQEPQNEPDHPASVGPAAMSEKPVAAASSRSCVIQ